MRKITILDILFWIAMLILIGYILAKLFGLINSPELVDLIPLITLVFLIGVFYQKVVTFMDIMYNKTNYLKNNLNQIKDKIIEYDSKLLELEK